MKNKTLHRIVALGAGLLCSLALATTARAELVSYNFTAKVDSASADMRKLGIGETVSGWFSYDTGIVVHSGQVVAPSVDLGLKELSLNGLTSITYNGKKLSVTDSIGITDKYFYSASLELSGQRGNPFNGIPSSLSLGGNARGSLTLDLWLNGSHPDLKATLTTLTQNGSNGGASTPELDPRSGAGALALVLGGLGIVLGRRRRS